ncbi:MAG: hypothetical protein H0Z33_01705 [Bacillaceae bacterium]|nr:hypothetical protein [Bacillaceae bacterium]
MTAFLISLLAFVANVPLGMWRETTRKFSLKWFIAIHASIPLIIYLRVLFEISIWWIPVNIALAVLGQWMGARFHHRRIQLISQDQPE